MAYPPVVQGVLEEAARRFTALVGDGCLIRMADPSGALAARAADHRDDDRRQALRALIDAPPAAARRLARSGARARPPCPPADLRRPGADRRRAACRRAPRRRDRVPGARRRACGPDPRPDRGPVRRSRARAVRAACCGPAPRPGCAGRRARSPSASRCRRPVRAGEPLLAGAFGSLRHGLVEVATAGLWVVDPRGADALRQRGGQRAGRLAEPRACRRPGQRVPRPDRRRSGAPRRRRDDRRPPVAPGRRQHVLARGDDPPTARRPR